MSNFYYIFLLNCVFVAAIPPLNLSTSCVHKQAVYCELFNLTESYDAPLLLANSQQTDLEELIVSNSQIRRIPSDIFSLAPKLRSLLLSNCGINRLDGRDFLKAQRLSKLLLQGNSFFILPEQLFASLALLEELYLAQNTIQLLHATAFSKLDKLRHLDLQQNSITALPVGLFGELNSLEHIDLSSNKISVIDEHTFSKNMQIRTLILGNNKFTVFQPRALEHLPHLHLLDISNSAVDELNLQAVDTLLAQGCGLSMCAIKGGVIKLKASNNRLMSGSLQIGNKLAVRDLDLHNNQLESVDDFSGMLNLQILDVSKNQISSLTTSVSPLYLPLPSLSHLNLASNLLSNLSANNFLLLPKLAYLDLAFNRLQQFELRVFKPLVNLEKFYVEGNHFYAMDYEQFVKSHAELREIGVFDNEFELGFLRTMLAYFRQQHIQLPVRFISTASSDAFLANVEVDVTDSSLTALPSTSQLFVKPKATETNKLREVSGIHPYWTRRDALTVAILFFVLFTLLLQLYRLLQEEPCILNACRRRQGNVTQNRPQRLHEDDSEV